MNLYREGIVAVVRNEQGNVLFCERSDHQGSWQFPQGGVEKDETPEQACIRELSEELGNGNCKILRKSESLVRYRWPKVGRDGMHGQEQTWLLVEFLPGELPNLAKSDHCFRAWKWISTEEALSQIVDWKRPAYLEGFRLLGL